MPVVGYGSTHSLELHAGGKVVSKGSNRWGQLGIGSLDRAGDGLSYGSLVPIGDNVLTTAVAAGAHHSLALTYNGELWSWGSNEDGQQGDASKEHQTSPALISLPGKAIAVAACDLHSLALLESGEVWARGQNKFGQLGIGSISDLSAPARVSLPSKATAIAAGCHHNVALLDNGEVWGWGRNDHGQLGDGSLTDRLGPVKVALAARTTAVAAGKFYCLALLASGEVWAWGRCRIAPWVGGDGAVCDMISPVKVSLPGRAVAVDAGDMHSLVLLDNGEVWAWGRNREGQIGDSSKHCPSTHVQVPLAGPATSVRADRDYSLATLADGKFWAWGFANNGLLDKLKVAHKRPMKLKGKFGGDIGPVSATCRADADGDAE